MKEIFLNFRILAKHGEQSHVKPDNRPENRAVRIKTGRLATLMGRHCLFSRLTLYLVTFPGGLLVVRAVSDDSRDVGSFNLREGFPERRAH